MTKMNSNLDSMVSASHQVDLRLTLRSVEQDERQAQSTVNKSDSDEGVTNPVISPDNRNPSA